MSQCSCLGPRRPSVSCDEHGTPSLAWEEGYRLGVAMQRAAFDQARLNDLLSPDPSRNNDNE